MGTQEGILIMEVQNMKVVGLGQCSLDCLALVDSFPEIDTKKEVLLWDEQGGGPVATALVALSRLGVDCAFHGVVGDDQEGTKIRQSLIDAGIDAGGLLMREMAASQKAFIVIERCTGKRTIFWRRPSGEALRPDELAADFLNGADFLLLDGLMKEASMHAALRAKEMDIPVMLDAGRVREGMIEIALLCSYVVASEEFAREIGYDGDAKRFGETIRNYGFGLTTITLGNKGSITFRAGEIINIPTFDVEAVDTTGAGDVFHGGYIYGIMKGWDIGAVVRFASAMAAMKCRKIGGRAGIAGLEEIIQFMGDRGVDFPPDKR